MYLKYFRAIFVILIFFSYTNADIINTKSVADKNVVAVSIVPQKVFVDDVGGGNFKVLVMVPPGSAPETYEPKPRQLETLSKAKAYILIGVPLEKRWIKNFKSLNSHIEIFDGSKDIKKIPIEQHTHDNTDDVGHHSHEILDPHIWLSLKLSKIQAKNVLNALIEIDPKNKDFYNTNYLNFLKKINKTDERIKKILKNVKNRVFVVLHPAWGYFAKEYNLEQLAIEEGSKDPKPKQIIKLIETIKEKNIKTIIVEPEFSKKSAQIIANSTDANIVTISPLSAKWPDNLVEMAKTIANSGGKN